MKQVRLIVEGQVQGVFYRYNARKAAENLGITGWIKNRPDGNVEVLAEGEKEPMKDFIAWCRKGSSLSVVRNVEISSEKDIERPSSPSFEIIY